MPYIKIVTNLTLTAEARSALLARTSAEMARQLSKPERYVMVEAADGAPLLFGSSDAPAAYVELKSIGLQPAQTNALSAAVAKLLQAELAIAPDRVYVEFSSPPGNLWGWNGGTF